MAGTVRTKTQRWEEARLGSGSREDRCGWWAELTGSLSQTVQKVGWGRAQGPCVPGHTVQACPGGDGSHGRFWSRSHRVYERHILFLSCRLREGSRQGTFKSCSEGQAGSCHGRRTRGPATTAGSSFRSVARWAQGTGARSPGPGDLASCVCSDTLLGLSVALSPSSVKWGLPRALS